MINKIFKILIWPIIFIIGQISIELIFASRFDSSIKGTMSNEEFLNYIKTDAYREGLSNYINDKIVIITLIIALIFIPIFYYVYKKYKTSNKLKNLFIPILLGITISLIYNITMFNLSNALNMYEYDLSTVPLIYQVLCSGILGPILEELLFRGIVYNKLKEITTSMKAIVLCSVFFGMIHFNIINAIYAFGISFMLIYLYEKYKTLKAPIIMHMVLNTTTILFVPFIVKSYIPFNSYLVVVSILALLIFRVKIKEDM